MVVPLNITNEPVAQTVFGLFGKENGSVQVNGFAIITFGFLFGGQWIRCEDESTSWSLKADESTTWTECE